MSAKIFLFLMGVFMVFGEAHISGDEFRLRYSHLAYALIPAAFLWGFRLTRKQTFTVIPLCIFLVCLPLLSGNPDFSAKPALVVLNLMLVPVSLFIFQDSSRRKIFFFGIFLGALIYLGIDFYALLGNLGSQGTYHNAIIKVLSWRECLRSEFPLRPGFLLAATLWLGPRWTATVGRSAVINSMWAASLGFIAATALSRGLIASLFLATIFLAVKKFRLPAIIMACAFLYAIFHYNLMAHVFEVLVKEQVTSAAAQKRATGLSIEQTGNFLKGGGTVGHRKGLWREMFSAVKGHEWFTGKGWDHLHFSKLKRIEGVHSWPIEMLYRTGIIGLTVLLLILLLLLPERVTLSEGIYFLLVTTALAPVSLFNDYFWLAPAWVFLLPLGFFSNRTTVKNKS